MKTSTIKSGIGRLEGLMKSHAGDGSLKASVSRRHMFSGILYMLVSKVYQYMALGINPYHIWNLAHDRLIRKHRCSGGTTTMVALFRQLNTQACSKICNRLHRERKRLRNRKSSNLIHRYLVDCVGNTEAGASGRSEGRTDWFLVNLTFLNVDKFSKELRIILVYGCKCMKES